MADRVAGRVAALQMVSGADWQQNLRSAADLIGQAAAGGAQLLLLPENFAVFDSQQLLERGRPEQDPDGPIRTFLAQQARQHGVWLVAGSLPILSADGRRVRAACLVYDDQGQEVARYDKLHLFDVDVADAQAAYRESEQIEPGDALVVVDTPVGRLGLSICYDLRFPQLYQQLANAGAELISVPAAFTQVTGEAHWELLLRARAIETQCYLIAANQGGVHNARRETFGHSMVVDPWGRVLNRHARGESVVVADTNLELVAEMRRKMPLLAHRRALGMLPTRDGG
ncbi:carbon-nitrogen hydrolase family protein [Motiliproteus sediminis]|uniref:carbon-nitrogen hydrolase family protein n=1 Tax=Motiliproteus sediminis TaxID=1468178 RepID=UPI0031BB870A